MPKITKSKLKVSKMECGCPKKWLRLSDDDIDKLELYKTKKCVNKHFMPVFFVHDEHGDYFAPKFLCNNQCDGKYIYFCTKCKNILDIQ